MEIFLFVSQYFSISRMKKFVASTWFSTHDQPLFIFICNFNEIHRREIFLRNRENQSTRNDPYNFHIHPKFERTNWWSILKRSSYPLEEKAGTRRLIRRNSPILEKLGLDGTIGVYRSTKMDLQFNFVGHPETPRGWSSVCGERNGVNKERVVWVTISGGTVCFKSNGRSRSFSDSIYVRIIKWNDDKLTTRSKLRSKTSMWERRDAF